MPEQRKTTEEAVHVEGHDIQPEVPPEVLTDEWVGSLADLPEDEMPEFIPSPIPLELPPIS